MSNLKKIMQSKATFQVFACVVRGIDYSTVIARELRLKHPTIVVRLKECEKAGLLQSFREGAAVRYKIVWKTISQIWLDWVVEQRLKNLEQEPHRFLLGEEKKDENTVKKRYTSPADFKNVKQRIEEIRNLIKKNEMIDFTKLVMETYAELNRDGYSLEDLFVFYAYETLPWLEESEKMKTSYPFYSQLKMHEKDEYTLGRLTATLLMKKIAPRERA